MYVHHLNRLDKPSQSIAGINVTYRNFPLFSMNKQMQTQPFPMFYHIFNTTTFFLCKHQVFRVARLPLKLCNTVISRKRWS